MINSPLVRNSLTLKNLPCVQNLESHFSLVWFAFTEAPEEDTDGSSEDEEEDKPHNHKEGAEPNTEDNNDAPGHGHGSDEDSDAGSSHSTEDLATVKEEEEEEEEEGMAFPDTSIDLSHLQAKRQLLIGLKSYYLITPVGYSTPLIPGITVVILCRTLNRAAVAQSVDSAVAVRFAYWYNLYT